MRMPPLKLKIMLESNALTSIMLVGRLAVSESTGIRSKLLPSPPRLLRPPFTIASDGHNDVHYLNATNHSTTYIHMHVCMYVYVYTHTYI